MVSGWLVSLCLHEYAHARTALHGGDITVGAKGYLTLNPLKYTHALLSIVLPVVFVIMGGIGLPGGAVFIERGRIRGRWRHSLISAAGPLTNVLFAALLHGAVLAAAPPDGVPDRFRFALAFLALLQVTAAILNFLPVPGLDGYGVIEPWLSHELRRQVEPFAPFGLLAVFGVLWIPGSTRCSSTRSTRSCAGSGVPELDTLRATSFSSSGRAQPAAAAVWVTGPRWLSRRAPGPAAPAPLGLAHGSTTPCCWRGRPAGPRRRRASCPGRRRPTAAATARTQTVRA